MGGGGKGGRKQPEQQKVFQINSGNKEDEQQGTRATFAEGRDIISVSSLQRIIPLMPIKKEQQRPAWPFS